MTLMNTVSFEQLNIQVAHAPSVLTWMYILLFVCCSPEMFMRGPHGEMMLRPGFGPPDMRGVRPPRAMGGKPYPGMPYPPRGGPGYPGQRMARQPMEMTPQVCTNIFPTIVMI